MRLDGHRPAILYSVPMLCDCIALPRARLLAKPVVAAAAAAAASSMLVQGIREASIFNAPVPHLRTFAAIVCSDNGLRATTIGSHAGLSAVPQPIHETAS